MFKVIILLSFLAAPALAANGNCYGFSQCASMSSKNINLQLLINAVNQYMSNSTSTTSNDPIACAQISGGDDGICAYFQNTAIGGSRTSGAWVKFLLQKLYSDSGCRVCGNYPVNYEQNSWNQGGLTVNYASDTFGCNGLCSMSDSEGFPFLGSYAAKFDGSS